MLIDVSKGCANSNAILLMGWCDYLSGFRFASLARKDTVLN
jgi:hypothetical protein